ncbi:hypothetical protein KWG64_06310 [Rahnella sp. PD12R]|uniref:hypothetical protein n=1 Tax=Rahnella sp. PD12R TaxID=2855688 RepID=UPI001C491639|nr:hypothetical protein [Rahnella sp. PD12R]MBV6817553.1 hypothetical protein [Rahnella sp. PD12R]
MKKLLCVKSQDSKCFTEGNIYEAEDEMDFIVGNDLDAQQPWVLTGMDVIAFNSKLASFEFAASHN